jgi:hypothetical protein
VPSVQSFYYDFLDATFFQQVKQAVNVPRAFRKLAGKPQEAANVNCLDEVPDSSWFTNRNGKRPMPEHDIERGPNTSHAPAGELWTVVRGKTEGITPGFTIEDEAGQAWVVKFDPPEYPELATAAEVAATRLYYAAGYNVKEADIIHFTRRQLKVGGKAKMKDSLGRTRKMTEQDLDQILSRVAQRSDGSYRAIASRFLAGVPKGPFSFHGMRPDDPNDLIPHEHRRDLRGLKVIAGWLNDNDIREGNTLDMYVEESGRRFLRHYLIDAGSALGSDTSHPNIDRIGNEYQFDGHEIGKSFITLGLYRRPWKGAGQNIVHPAVGYIDVEHYRPAAWKPNYPTVAFDNMTTLDGFWAARIVMSFTDEQIRAAVRAGRFSDPKAAETLASILIARRDKLAMHWLEQASPLAHFSVSGDRLSFENLSVKHGYAASDEFEYRYSIRHVSTRRVLGSGEAFGSVPLKALEAVRDADPGVVEIEITAWDKAENRVLPAVRVYVRQERIVGIDRG